MNVLRVVPRDDGAGPVDGVVQLLSMLLERAKSGDIRQIAVVFVDRHGRPTDAATGGTPEEILPLISGLEICKVTLVEGVRSATGE